MAHLNRRSFLTLAAGVPLAVASLPAAVAHAAPARGRITGLLAREPDQLLDPPDGRLHGFVQPLTWAEAQPTAGGPISPAAVAKLEAAVDLARDRGYPKIKLRLLAGHQSPAWALALGGGPIADWLEPENGKKFVVPRWWCPQFLDAYAAFLTALAPHLTAPEWCEATVAGTTTIFAEPLIHQLGVADNRSKALEAGYTDVRDRDALYKAIADQHAAFSPFGISSSVAYNPWQMINDKERLEVRMEETITAMNYQRTLAGNAGIWANNSLMVRQLPDGTLEQARPDYQRLYDHMIAGAAGGHPIQFQTATLAKITDAGGTPLATATWAANGGGLSVELPLNWEREGSITPAQATSLNTRMATNATRT
ncbi:hypothetical protein Asp14428_07150 [Actinoplanes sp. NBRC 14428]|nr:hypothetical protein Asp14428_07150 [Actinoplanes sp. NBRC 14428]